jgi:hypothetical protein
MYFDLTCTKTLIICHQTSYKVFYVSYISSKSLVKLLFVTVSHRQHLQIPACLIAKIHQISCK